MRYIFVLLLLSPTLAFAGDFPWPWTGPPACDPQPRCDYPGAPPCGPPRELTPPPREQTPPPRDLTPPQQEIAELEETGAFVAPPRTGATRGPINRTGIEGMSITFPSLRLSMPSIELPCKYHGRSEARMMIDAAEAPYVRTGYQVRRTVVPATTATQTPRDLSAPAEREAAPKAPTPMDCETQLKQLEDKYAQLQRELEDCMRQQRSIQVPPGNKSMPPKSMSPQQAPPMPAYEESSRRQQVLVNPASYSSDHFSLRPMHAGAANYETIGNAGFQRLPAPSDIQGEGWTNRR